MFDSLIRFLTRRYHRPFAFYMSSQLNKGSPELFELFPCIPYIVTAILALNDDDSLLNPFNSRGQYGLIRERVSKYLDESVPMTSYGPTYQSRAGDQGTFIGGFMITT